MRTLVIHPKDPTTEFLCALYEDRVNDWTIIRFNPSKRVLISHIKTHDRIIMLGHGTFYGLLNPFNGNMLIAPKHVYLLREKYCVGIWCHANIFFEKYQLKGKYTGMMISEPDEADYYDVSFTNKSQIDESNKLFSEVMKHFIEDGYTLEDVLEKYNDSTNPIINYNRQRIFETKQE